MAPVAHLWILLEMQQSLPHVCGWYRSIQCAAAKPSHLLMLPARPEFGEWSVFGNLSSISIAQCNACVSDSCIRPFEDDRRMATTDFTRTGSHSSRAARMASRKPLAATGYWVRISSGNLFKHILDDVSEVCRGMQTSFQLEACENWLATRPSRSWSTYTTCVDLRCPTTMTYRDLLNLDSNKSDASYFVLRLQWALYKATFLVEEFSNDLFK